MRELLTIRQAKRRGVDGHTLQKARQRDDYPHCQILHIVWDEGDYPECPWAWGFEQWSVRPFVQRQGCDGTIDENVHVIGEYLCAAIGLDYAALYEEAYHWQRLERGSDTTWLRRWLPKNRKRVQAETILPAVSDEALRSLLHDLEDINHHSLVGVLEERFQQLGYEVERWWER